MDSPALSCSASSRPSRAVTPSVAKTPASRVDNASEIIAALLALITCIFCTKDAVGTHEVNTVNPVAAFEITNIIAHLFHSSNAIPPQHMRKVGLHAELFSDLSSRSNGSHTPTLAVSTGIRISSVATSGTVSSRGFIFLDPPKFINRHRPHRLM